MLEDRRERVRAHTGEYIAGEVGLRRTWGRWLVGRRLLVGGGAGGRELEGGVVGGLCRCHRFRSTYEVSEQMLLRGDLR